MVGNWLYGVAHQTALRAKVATAKRRVRERQVANMPEPEAVQGNLWSDLVPLLDQKLSRLPAKYRSPIILCDLEGKTYKEAARNLGCPEGTLSARLVRGRSMLAKRLIRHGLAVSGTTLAGLLSGKAATACMPPFLVASTVKIVNLWAAGSAASAGLVSAKVAALTEGVLKTMLLTKIKVGTGLLLLATMAISSAGWSIIQTKAGQPTETSKKDANAPTKIRVEKSTHLVKVPSLLDGIVQFIGTDINEGEIVPPEKTISVQVGGVRKIFRPLKKGDSVKEGQLLARLDDRLARAQMAVQESKVRSSKADFDGAKAIAEEAENKLKIAEDLHRKHAIALEDFRSAQLTGSKMHFDMMTKKEAVKQAELEMEQVQTLIELHEIRCGVKGVIAVIHKRSGEGIRKFETVFEIEVTDPDLKKESNEKSTHLLRVPSQVKGVVRFIGREIREGEKISPEKLIVVKVGSEKKQFHRLKPGDPIKEGELLVLLDDRLARVELAIKESKLSSSMVDFSGADAVAKEADARLKTAEDLFTKHAIALDDFRSAQLTRNKMHFESVSKKEAVNLAKEEVNVAREMLKQYEIRAKGSGIIAAIRKYPSEAVRAWETVVEIEVSEK